MLNKARSVKELKKTPQVKTYTLKTLKLIMSQMITLKRLSNV